ncbi:unnamed protein product [Ilex paraguariensis]|uniref:Protein kinase domain-containing protein n=1 Tax=Ilex paraguariensis TaxID=185542 RepID=A0ABC8QWQ2_9AQUA
MEKLHKLRFVDIGWNSFGSGGPDNLGFLSSLTNATHLTELNLYHNKFGGRLPESICNLSTMLEVFCLNDNYIVGSIPAGIGSLINLNSLVLSVSQLIGNIPPDIGKLKKLNVWFFDRNKFTGFIPFSVGNLSLLLDFRISENNFQGSIPSSLGKWKNLLSLDLFANNFCGTIPLEVLCLSSLSIYLDLSQNNLSGSLPPEEGNLKSLGQLAVSDNMLSDEIPSTLSSCVMLQVLYKQRNSFRGPIPSSLSFSRGIQELDLSRNNLSKKISEYLIGFQLKELNLSFNDFDSEEIYGEGSYGSVYKGVLEDQNGNESVVAVKVLNLSHQGASKSFLSECEALRNIGHRNLVNVVTACSGADYQGNDFKALVYEFKENTSQPNNILLNKDKVAHVGDFGLARSLLNASYSNSAQQTSSSIGLRGSIGYVAPEYGLGSEPSMRGDVMVLPERVADVADSGLIRHDEVGETSTNPRP